MMSQNQRLIAELTEKLHRVSWNKALGCYTRNGFEEVIWPDIAASARWIVYFDINHLHQMNELYDSFAPVNAMIKQVLSIVRKTDHVAGQVNSGDEFLVVLTETETRKVLDPEGLQERIIAEMKTVGMTATFAIVAVTSQDLMENLKPAIAQVKAAKKARGIEAR
jgi:GGDEF domain-containing protein